MHPEKERFARLRLEPTDRPIYDFSGRTLGRLTAHFAPRRLRHLVVVDRESVVESEPLFQNGRPDERRRVPPRLLQNLRQCRIRRLQDKSARISYLVHRRIRAGKHTCVRRSRERGLANGVLE